MWVLTIASGVMLFAINFKLTWILRRVTRGGGVNALDASEFWFNRPWLLLEALRNLLFVVSLVFACEVFNATL